MVHLGWTANTTAVEIVKMKNLAIQQTGRVNLALQDGTLCGVTKVKRILRDLYLWVMQKKNKKKNPKKPKQIHKQAKKMLVLWWKFYHTLYVYVHFFLSIKSWITLIISTVELCCDEEISIMFWSHIVYTHKFHVSSMRCHLVWSWL